MRLSNVKKLNSKRHSVWLGADKGWYGYYNCYAHLISDISELVYNRSSTVEIYLPFMFLIRHALELGLEALISFLKEFLKIDNKKIRGTHKLVELYEDVDDNINKCLNQLELSSEAKEQLKNFKEILEECVDKFQTLDETAQRFRYPCKIKGNDHFKDSEWLDIGQYLEMLSKLEPFFLFTTCVFAEARRDSFK